MCVSQAVALRITYRRHSRRRQLLSESLCNVANAGISAPDAIRATGVHVGHQLGRSHYGGILFGCVHKDRGRPSRRLSDDRRIGAPKTTAPRSEIARGGSRVLGSRWFEGAPMCSRNSLQNKTDDFYPTGIHRGQPMRASGKPTSGEHPTQQGDSRSTGHASRGPGERKRPNSKGGGTSGGPGEHVFGRGATNKREARWG